MNILELSLKQSLTWLFVFRLHEVSGLQYIILYGSWWNIIQQPLHSLGRCKAYDPSCSTATVAEMVSVSVASKHSPDVIWRCISLSSDGNQSTSRRACNHSNQTAMDTAGWEHCVTASFWCIYIWNNSIKIKDTCVTREPTVTKYSTTLPAFWNRWKSNRRMLYTFLVKVLCFRIEHAAFPSINCLIVSPGNQYVSFIVTSNILNRLIHFVT